MLALFCLAGGIFGSLQLARNAARSDATKSRRAFAASVAGIASTLNVSIQREEDLASAASAFFAEHPKATPAAFSSWAKRVELSRRYPELQKLGFVTIVREEQLPEFQAQVSGHPIAPASSTLTATSTATVPGAATVPSAAASPSGAGIHLIPPGKRGYYCLPAAGFARAPAKAPPTGLDYCAKSSALLLARDAGASVYSQVSVAGGRSLGVQTPVYADPARPATSADRVKSFVGWLTEVLAPEQLLGRALQGRPANAARLGYHSGRANLVFTSGKPSPDAQSRTSDLHNGWTIRSYGPALSTAIMKDSRARELLLAGILASALLGLSVLLLGAGRSGAPRAARPPRAPRTPRTPKHSAVLREDLYDTLTGLPNRALLTDRAERMLARASRDTGLLVGALVVDVDWFKDINDKLGPAAGDQVLKIVGERLEHVIRQHDSVGRMENDQFVILVEASARGARLDALARRVIEALHKPVDLADFGPGFLLTASIGVAFGRHETIDALLHDAYLALQAAKAAGKDRYTLFNANMRAVLEGQSVLETELNAALQDKQFFLLYQPIVELASHKVVGLEALIRWRHPSKGVLAPADFIPLAEETGLIVPIGRWVLEEACSQAAAWNLGGERVGISVMISPNQLNREGFPVDVRRALQQSGLDAGLLTLEIAEATVMHDLAAASERLGQIKQLGVLIAIDDFGSGYAYRSDLQRMPVDYLKVDRSALAASDDEDYRTWLLEAILVFGRDLSLTVIAKGIETEAHVEALKTMGCTLAQGFFLGEPLPTSAVPALLPVTPSPALGVSATTAPLAAAPSAPGAAAPSAPGTAAPSAPGAGSAMGATAPVRSPAIGPNGGIPAPPRGPAIGPDTSPSSLYH